MDHAFDAIGPNALDLEAEYARARMLTVDDIAGFLAAGVPPRALNRQPDGCFLPIRRDVVAIDRDRFDFAAERPGAEAGPAFVLPLVDAAGEVADILAFRPDGAAALWLGRVAMVGEDEVSAPRLGEPLDVHADVMGWLRAGRRGVAILDHARAAASLHGVTLRTVTAEHARRLRVALARPAPRIVVAPVAHARAA